MDRDWRQEFDAVAKKVNETNRKMLRAVAAANASRDSRGTATSSALHGLMEVAKEWESAIQEERNLIAEFRKEP